MGYDRALFQKSLKPELICGVCYKVLYLPHTVKCGHFFCEECVHGRRPLRICPTCSTVLRREKNEEEEEEADNEVAPPPPPPPPPATLLIELDVLQLTCPQRCGKTLSLKFVAEHLADNCPQTTVQCENRSLGCQESVTREKQKRHAKECVFRKVSCTACGTVVLLRDLQEHQMRKRCLDRALKLDQARCNRRCSTAIKEHNIALKEDAIRTLQDGRRITLAHWASRGISAFQKYRPQEEDEGKSKLKEDDPKLTCERCLKLFSQRKNHSRSCLWHKGPFIETFGGMCVACGKQNNLGGCVMGYHYNRELRRHQQQKLQRLQETSPTGQETA